MILISSHLDRVIAQPTLAYAKGQHVGLLDNFLGVLLTYLTLYDDPVLRDLEAEGRIGIYHNRAEEWGRLSADAPKLGKKDVALVVDICCGAKYCGYDFTLENFSGFTKADAEGMRNHLQWEGMNPYYGGHQWNPDPDLEDETWSWRKRGVKTVSFGIPIQAENDGWHRVQCDNTIDYGAVLVAKQGLKRTIAYLLG